MDHKPNRSNLGQFYDRLLDWLKPKEESIPAGVQKLADRITEVMTARASRQPLNEGQQAFWQQISPLMTHMYTRYSFSQVHRNLQRNPHDPVARQEWQNLLLGVLTEDKELHEQFSVAALEPAAPKAVARVTSPEHVDSVAAVATVTAAPIVEALTTREPAPNVETVTSPEPVPGVEDATRVDILPVLEETSSLDASPAPQPEASVVTEDDLPLGYKQLASELKSDSELYKVVYALRYNNPSLFELAYRLADNQGLSGDLSNLVSKLSKDDRLSNEMCDMVAKLVREPRLNSELPEFLLKSELGKRMTS